MEPNDKDKFVNIFEKNMQEIKMRTKAIESIYNRKTTTLFNETNVEFCAQQLRTIFELIIMSSLTTNSKEYYNLHNQLKEDWNLPTIVKKLKMLNTEYLPIKIKIKNPDDIGNLKKILKFDYEVNDDINEEFILKKYYELSSYIHARNPFTKQIKYENLMNDFIGILNKIKNFMNTNIYSMDNSQYLFLTIIDFNSDNHVKIFLLDKIKSLN